MTVCTSAKKNLKILSVFHCSLNLDNGCWTLNQTIACPLFILNKMTLFITQNSFFYLAKFLEKNLYFLLSDTRSSMYGLNYRLHLSMASSVNILIHIISSARRPLFHHNWTLRTASIWPKVWLYPSNFYIKMLVTNNCILWHFELL